MEQVPQSKDGLTSGARTKLQAIAALAIAGIMAMVVTTALFKPLRAYETFAIVALATSPLWVAGGVALRRRIPTVPDNAGKLAPFTLLVPFGLLGVLGAVTYTLNAVLDDAPGEEHTVTVTGKDYTSGKHGKHYYAILPTMTPSSMVEWGLVDAASALDQEEHAALSRMEYDALIPGVSQVSITLKPGYLGFPWVAHTQVIVNVAPPQPPVASGPAEGDYQQGLAYYKGQGAPKDDVRAVRYFRMAAEAGSSGAQRSLAYMYANGLGGLTHDDAQANMWLRKAADQGDPIAEDDLGVSYGDGRGIAQDWVESYAWIARAAKQGYPQAIQDLNYAAARMTPEQIARAKARAETPLAGQERIK